MCPFFLNHQFICLKLFIRSTYFLIPRHMCCPFCIPNTDHLSFFSSFLIILIRVLSIFSKNQLLALLIFFLHTSVFYFIGFSSYLFFKIWFFVLSVASWNANLKHYVLLGITIHSKKLIEDKYLEIFLTFSGFSGFPFEKKKSRKTDEW